MKTVTLIENKEKGDYVIINDGKTTSLAPVKAFLDRDDICDFSVSALVADVKTGKLENVIVNAIAYKRSMDEFLSVLNANDTSEFVIDNYSRNMLEQALAWAREMVETCAEPGTGSEFDYKLNVDNEEIKNKLELARDNMILENAIIERGFDYDLFNITRIYNKFSRKEASRLISFTKSINDVKGDDFIILYGSDSMAMIVKMDSNLYFFSKNHEDTMITWEKCDSGLDFKWVLNCERTYNAKLPAAIKEIASNELNKIVERCTKPEEQDNKSGDPCGEDGKNGDDVAGQVPDVDQECCRSYVNLEWLKTKYKLNDGMEKREFNEFPFGKEGKDPVEIYYNNYKEELIREIKEREMDMALIYPSRDNHEVVDLEYFHLDDSDMVIKIGELLKEGLYFRVVNYHASQEYTIVMYLGHEDVEENGIKVYKTMIEVPAIGFKRHNYLFYDVIRKIDDYMKSDECKTFVVNNWKNFRPTNNEPSTVKLENITRISDKKYFTVSFQQIMDGVAKVNI